MTAATSLAGPLAGKTVVITGGSRGIGAAIVEQSGLAGANVAFTFVEREAQANDVAERARASGRRCEGYRLDVADRDAVERFIKRVETEIGPIDGVVNNAGIMPITPFLEMDPAEWDRVLKTDLYGTYHVCRAVLPFMTERGHGSIVNVSSRLGHIGAPRLAHYSAAKAGVIGLTKALAREFGPFGIRVNAVSPGPTMTEMGASGTQGEEGRRKLEESALRRFSEPGEVAAAVIFLLSDASSAFTGQTLSPNAGSFMP